MTDSTLTRGWHHAQHRPATNSGRGRSTRFVSLLPRCRLCDRHRHLDRRGLDGAMTVRAPEWKKSSKNCPRREVSLKGPPKSRSFSSARRRWRFFFLLLASITRLDSVTTSLNFRPQQPFHTRIFRAEESPRFPFTCCPPKAAITRILSAPVC